MLMSSCACWCVSSLFIAVRARGSFLCVICNNLTLFHEDCRSCNPYKPTQCLILLKQLKVLGAGPNSCMQYVICNSNLSKKYKKGAYFDGIYDHRGGVRSVHQGRKFAMVAAPLGARKIQRIIRELDLGVIGIGRWKFVASHMIQFRRIVDLVYAMLMQHYYTIHQLGAVQLLFGARIGRALRNYWTQKC
uniref:Putative secreted protein n=1 Tax=Ixodes ricinus TaxID=34613 RepID=A0A6B0V1I3_IXORI